MEARAVCSDVNDSQQLPRLAGLGGDSLAPLDPRLERHVAERLAAPRAWEMPLHELRAGPEERVRQTWGEVEDVAEVVDLLAGGSSGHRAGAPLPLRGGGDALASTGLAPPAAAG